MADSDTEIDWSLTTWEGSRREQLRRWCKLSVRERLLAVEEMADLARHFAQMRAQGRFRHVDNSHDGGAPTSPGRESDARQPETGGVREPHGGYRAEPGARETKEPDREDDDDA